MSRPGIFAIIVAAAMSPACGSAGNAIPAEVVCGTPVPVPTSRAAPGSASTRAYWSRLQEGSSRLYQLREDLRGKYPEDTFYRREDFRPDFVAYADASICLARELLAIAHFPAQGDAFTDNLIGALDAFVAHSEAGREAIRTRNVSAYRDGYSAVDGQLAGVVGPNGCQRPSASP